MIFAHDTERALAGAAALVNSCRGNDGTATEDLADLAALDEFATSWQWTGGRRHDLAELIEVKRLRPRLIGLWYANEDEAVTIVNGLLQAAHALPQLLKHDGWGYHVHATSADAPLADRMAVEAAMAMTDVIRMQELSRLRLCSGEVCERVLVDLSKNRSRRYCEAGCGNRANVAAFRARQRQQ